MVDSPFDTSGVEVGADGIRRYAGLSGTVVDMLRSTVERHGERTAVVELDGPSVTYRELWDRASRVAGGLRDAGVPCEVMVVEGAFHGFDGIAPKASVSQRFFDSQCAMLRTAFAASTV